VDERMSDPPRGAFPHQHGDPRTLSERIDAQLRERIEEAIEMAALELLVENRKRRDAPAPEATSASDRDEFRRLAQRLLEHLDRALAPLAPAPPARGAAAATPPDPVPALARQVSLARTVPDYWQRLDTLRREFAQGVLSGDAPQPGWLQRLFRR
jgi:hypothetical protein